MNFYGSGKTLEKLIGEYTSPLFGFVFQLVHDRQTAEDIVQETWIKVWKHRHSFDQKKSFKTWIFTIAKNTAFDFLKKKKSIPFSSFENEDGVNTLDVSDENIPLPDVIFSEKESRENILSALEGIPLLYRTLLLLAYRDDFSLREIASILDEPYNTIKSRHQRAIKLLRKAIISEDASDER